ncbi:MAG: glycosyl hydrolase, partial [Acidimicrobiia bacterium]
MDRADARWVRIGDNMPADVGDIGFPIELHPRDADTAWVFPMDGTDVWPRTSPDGRPAVYVTRDAGATWDRRGTGLPEPAWFTVKRQAMTVDHETSVGVYFGTTSGELWASADEGGGWRCIASHLPEIYSVEYADPDPSLR